MSSEIADIDQILFDWTEEFSRAVEMFSGEKAQVYAGSVSRTPPEGFSLDHYLWWKQDFEADPVFTTWVGAEQAAWSLLGGSLGTEGEEAKQLFFEMLGQAQQGAGTLQAGHRGHELRCSAGTSEAPASPDALLFAKIDVTFKGELVPALCYAFAPAVLTALHDDPAPPTHALVEPQLTDTGYGPMLSRIMDLDLPLSVALGRSNLPIQDILKLTSGSLIELDRRVGESVELLIHGTVVARGDVVSVKGNYAIRIREIISRTDRLALQKK